MSTSKKQTGKSADETSKNYNLFYFCILAVIAKGKKLAEEKTPVDSLFKSFLLGVEQAAKAPYIDRFDYPLDPKKALQAAIKGSPPCSERDEIISNIEILTKIFEKNNHLSARKRVAMVLIQALVKSFKSGHYTKRVSLLFRQAEASCEKPAPRRKFVPEPKKTY